VDGGVFQTDDVGKGGVSKKSVFAKTSLMDDPLWKLSFRRFITEKQNILMFAIKN